MLSETTASETAERGLRRAAAPARRVSAQGGTITDPSVTPGQPLAPAHRSVGTAPRKSVRDEAVSRPALEHLPKTTVEEFVLTQLSGKELEQIEEHLLICEECRDEVQELEKSISRIRAYAARL